jgi:hypothetical protein
MLPTALPDPLPRILRALLGDLEATFGPDLVAVYLYGSAVGGGFDPEASDLDLAIVLRHEIGEVGRRPVDGLVERLAAREPAWADRLDLVFVGQSTLRAFRSGGPLLSISHDEPLQRYDDADTWLQTWFLVRGGIRIVGPPIDSLIPPITLAEFTAAVAADAHRLRANLAADSRPGLLAYTVLTFARVACLLATGSLLSKQAAATWLEARHPADRAALEASLRVRASGGRMGFGPGEAAAATELAAKLGDEIERERAAER